MNTPRNIGLRGGETPHRLRAELNPPATVEYRPWRDQPHRCRPQPDLSAILFVVTLFFVHHSFHGMRIESGEKK